MLSISLPMRSPSWSTYSTLVGLELVRPGVPISRDCAYRPGSAVNRPESGGVNILHATSTADDITLYDCHLKVNDTLFRPQFRIIKCFDTLVKYQLSLVVECIAAEAQALIGSGLGSPGRASAWAFSS